jgi:hypothetical protein
MSDFIFLGPSLPLEQARSLHPGAVFLPPVAMGDLYALVRTLARPGDRIAIIDGLFEQVPAVWHKEVLFAIESGMTVYGASSMGALRAAELHPFGMHGVGRIFEAYRDGFIEDDDEVVVAHATGDQGYRSLSAAMVSLRFGLQQMRAAGQINDDDHDMLLAHAKALHYSARSWAALVGAARVLAMGDALIENLKQMARTYDAKADDARLLLSQLANATASEPAQDCGFVLEQTAFWVALTRSQEARIARDLRGGTQPGQAHDADVLSYVRAGHPNRGTVIEQAALLRIADESTRGWKPAARDLKAAAQRIARSNGLAGAAELQAWRKGQQLDGDNEWLALLDLEARKHAFMQKLMPGLDGHLVASLKTGSHYGGALAQVARMRDRFGADRTKRLSLEDSGVSTETLQQWYEEQFGPMFPDPEAHAHNLGFESLRDFIAEILAAYLLDQAPVD